MDLQVWVSCYATHASVASLPRKDGNGRDSEFFAWNLAIFQSLREREAKSLVAIQYIKILLVLVEIYLNLSFMDSTHFVILSSLKSL